MNTSHKWTYYTVMFTESLTRAGLIKFIFCNQYCSLVAHDINYYYYLIILFSRDGSSTGPKSINSQLSFPSNTVSNTVSNTLTNMASSWHKWTATHISTLFSKEDQDWFLVPNKIKTSWRIKKKKKNMTIESSDSVEERTWFITLCYLFLTILWLIYRY